MREIPLTRGKTALVDDSDFEWLSAWAWSANVSRDGRCYAQRLGGRALAGSMHRLIMSAPAGVLVDHINGDGLDNRRANLRLCDRSQNACNVKQAASNKTGFRGVSPAGRKWRATIRVRGVRMALGRHADPETAARAYDAKARELHGEFASLNFPDEPTADVAALEARQ